MRRSSDFKFYVGVTYEYSQNRVTPK